MSKREISVKFVTVVWFCLVWLFEFFDDNLVDLGLVYQLPGRSDGLEKLFQDLW